LQDVAPERQFPNATLDPDLLTADADREIYAYAVEPVARRATTRP
jgi:hypothetical protein